MRRAWWCLGVTWGLGMVAGGIHVLTVPLLVAAFAIYSAFVASLGLFCSTVCRSTLRATVATLVVLLILGGVPALVRAQVHGKLGTQPLTVGEWIVWWVHYGQTLPVSLWVLALGYDEVGNDEPGWWAPPLLALMGLAFYAAAAWLLWLLTLDALRREAGRVPRRQQPRSSLAEVGPAPSVS
jgi:hypothetical protein